MKKRLIISILLTIAAMIATYKLWHHAPVLIFISIMILSFLLSYKITDYIADFKTVKNNSRIDIVFLLIFFILLCIPASHISKAKLARGEFRSLAKKTAFIKHSKINLDFGKEYNEWFSDRFYLRSEAIRTNMIVSCMINSNNCNLGGFIFNKKHNLIYREFDFWGLGPIVENKEGVLKTYASNVKKFSEYCANKNIDLYFLIVPRASDYFAFDMGDKRKYTANPADEVMEYIKNKAGIKLIYPKEKLSEANKITPVFYKTDHHWTKKGAYVGYSEIIKEIQKTHKDVKLLDDDKLEKYYDNKVSACWDAPLSYGQTCRQMKLPAFYIKKVLDTPYIYYKNPEFNNLKKVDSEFVIDKMDVHFEYPKGAKEKLLVVGDSFGCNLFEFMPYSFRESLYIYNNRRGLIFKNYKSVIEKYKPDILVIIFYTPSIQNFLDLYPNEYSYETNRNKRRV